MKKSLLAGVAVLGLSMFAGFSYAADDAKSEKITGVLIDQTCGGNQMKKDDPEAAAAKHPMACAKKESCAKSGYAIISGKTMYKLDKDSAEKATAYLNDKDHKSTKVTVMGTKDGDMLKVTSIEETK
jgi:hypothetical protein